ncbi:MAG: ribosome recycling factor [Angelakisella sp.]|jgi:ribosome recycling factor|nr:ribosome recycling factor [Angelakisella sp.]
MSPELKVYEEKMNKTLGVMTSEFASIRAGRANPAVLDKVLVDYYGTPTKIREMASVSVSEARVLVIQPYDKGSLRNIERAIQTSDIGINPANDGTVLRLTFPQLTEERRKEIVKQVSRLAEDSKVAIRSIRRDANDRFKAMKKNGEATEDDVKSLETQIQKLTDKFVEEIDKLAAAKEKEILSI